MASYISTSSGIAVQLSTHLRVYGLGKQWRTLNPLGGPGSSSLLLALNRTTPATETIEGWNGTYRWKIFQPSDRRALFVSLFLCVTAFADIKKIINFFLCGTSHIRINHMNRYHNHKKSFKIKRSKRPKLETSGS